MVAEMFILIHCKNFRLYHFISETIPWILITEKFTRSNTKESNNYRNR